MARTAKISKDKCQSIITLSQREKLRTLKGSSSAVAKTIKGYDETGSHGDARRKEDPESPLLQRISSLELTAPQIADQINASQSSSNRQISTSTVKRRHHY
jgi:hypothetical protein